MLTTLEQDIYVYIFDVWSDEIDTIQEVYVIAKNHKEAITKLNNKIPFKTYDYELQGKAGNDFTIL